MERGKTPSLVVNPRPAPGLNPRPIPLAIGRPACGHIGIPDIAVACGSRPAAIGAKLRSAGHRRRAGGSIAATQLLLRLHPGHERIRGAGGTHLGLYGLLAGEYGRLAGAYVQIETIAADMCAAVEDSDLRGMLGISGDHLVTSRGGKRHRCPCHRHFVRSVLIERAQHEEHRALRQRELRRRIVESGDVKLGRAVEIDSVACHIDRCVSIGLGPEGLAGGHRIIAPCGLPVVLVRGVIGHRAVNEREPADPRGRILCSVLRAGCTGKRGEGPDRQEKGGEHGHVCFGTSRAFHRSTAGLLSAPGE
jgi:hypothetical protein